MRSSPAYADLVLDLPPVTVADRVTAALTMGAGLYGALVLAGQGGVAVAGLTACAGLLVTGKQAIDWTRFRARGALRLERGADGSLQVRSGAGRAVPATVGAGTRRLGPSVFLDLRFALDGRATRYRRWLTPRDVPAAALRRWSVVLPRSGRVACA